MSFSLQDLNQRVKQRAAASTETSYTAQLLAKGIEQCAQKLGEEATETIIAAVSNDKVGTTKEAADLLYHLLVLLRCVDVPLQNVMDELAARTAQSGLEEKASRQT